MRGAPPPRRRRRSQTLKSRCPCRRRAPIKASPTRVCCRRLAQIDSVAAIFTADGGRRSQSHKRRRWRRVHRPGAGMLVARPRPVSKAALCHRSRQPSHVFSRIMHLESVVAARKSEEVTLARRRQMPAASLREKCNISVLSIGDVVGSSGVISLLKMLGLLAVKFLSVCHFVVWQYLLCQSIS